MDRLRLRQLVLEFTKLAIDNVLVQVYEDGEPSTLTTAELLRVWGDDPTCLLSPMFIGYAMGEGEDVNAFTPEVLSLAVKTALIGESKDVDFDWMGDCDVTSKPH